MEKGSRYVECGLTGLCTGFVDNDLVAGAEDTELPVGWLEITVRRVVVNPDYIADLPTVEDVVAQQLSVIPAEHQEEARGLFTLNARATIAQIEAVHPPEHLIEEVTIHLSPDCVRSVIDLDVEAFVDAGWIPESELVDAQPEPMFSPIPMPAPAPVPPLAIVPEEPTNV